MMSGVLGSKGSAGREGRINQPRSMEHQQI